MFTGIITHVGKVESIKQSHYTFSADASFFQKLGQGTSVSVNGICLTVDADTQANSFSIEVMPETIKKTMIGGLNIGQYVNLELPMSADALFAGHIVQGHIDGTGRITAITPEGNSHIVTIGIKPKLACYVINKGSIAVNGISLTIISARNSSFTVGIIPYTFSHTMLHAAKVGDLVNIEVDMVGKYLFKFFTQAKKKE
ncbi:MAG: riboflavin synthase [Candidatus Levybacteria bacterium]|nr:riboflavin synthase [Candidatus Levybacteria bacterium]